MERFQEFRAFYREHMQEILEVGPDMWGGPGGPYGFDWPSIFTPIEMQIWFSIRSSGIVMYPQFPIGRYFADFANPHKKVVIECDGAEWHSRAKDADRDRYMAEKGWSVYRIPGRACFGESLDFSQFDGDEAAENDAIEKWSRTGDALVKAVACAYFDHPAAERLYDAYRTALSHFYSRDCAV